MTETRNTSFTYQYRDGGNNKVSHRVIFAGAMTLAMRDDLLGGLMEPDAPDDWGDFIPGQVGILDLQASFSNKTIAALESLLKEGDGPVQTLLPQEERDRLEALLEDEGSKTAKWTDEDHPVHEVLDMRPTDEAPTEHRTIGEFIEEVCATRWSLDYRPPFYGEMVENQRAFESSENVTPET